MVSLRLCLRSILALTLAAGVVARAEDAPDDAASAEVVASGPVIEAPPAPEAGPAEDKRVFGVLPNYRTAEETGIYAPIPWHHKLHIATKDTFDFPLFFLGGALAGLAQWDHQHPDFGQGLRGYAKRYVTAYTDEATGTLLTEGVMPILFHEDPRYFRRGSQRGGVWYRTYYAASRIVVTRTDHGAGTVNFAELSGNAISALIGNAYYRQERSVADNFSRWGVALGADAISQVLHEFWPDIKEKHLRRRPQTAN